MKITVYSSSKHEVGTEKEVVNGRKLDGNVDCDAEVDVGKALRVG